MAANRRFKTKIQADAGIMIPASAAAGRVFTSDGAGNGTWTPIPSDPAKADLSNPTFTGKVTAPEMVLTGSGGSVGDALVRDDIGVSGHAGWGPVVPSVPIFWSRLKEVGATVAVGAACRFALAANAEGTVSDPSIFGYAPDYPVTSTVNALVSGVYAVNVLAYKVNGSAANATSEISLVKLPTGGGAAVAMMNDRQGFNGALLVSHTLSAVMQMAAGDGWRVDNVVGGVIYGGSDYRFTQMSIAFLGKIPV